MGNCIDVQKPILWVDDEEWEEPGPDSPAAHCRQKEEAQGYAEAGKDEEGEGGAGVSTEIKIKISKKQLEELLRRVDEEGLPLKKVLADLVVIGGICLENRDGQWRPNLQSISEVSE